MLRSNRASESSRVSAMAGGTTCTHSVSCRISCGTCATHTRSLSAGLPLECLLAHARSAHSRRATQVGSQGRTSAHAQCSPRTRRIVWGRTSRMWNTISLRVFIAMHPDVCPEKTGLLNGGRVRENDRETAPPGAHPRVGQEAGRAEVHERLVELAAVEEDVGRAAEGRLQVAAGHAAVRQDGGVPVLVAPALPVRHHDRPVEHPAARRHGSAERLLLI